jgi:hypothetical protein
MKRGREFEILKSKSEEIRETVLKRDKEII